MVADLQSKPYWNPSWDTDTQRDVARSIVLGGHRGALPVLADACENAGCDSVLMLDQLRRNDKIQDHSWLLGRLSKLGAAEVFNRYRPEPVQPTAVANGTPLRHEGVFTWANVRDNLFIDPVAFSNIATTAGLNYMLEVMFRSGTQLTTWYASIIDSTSYSAVAAADTMSSHGGWIEFTSWSGATRPTWSPAAAAAGIIANTTVFSFTLTGNMTAKGLFITSGSAKSGTIGTLFSTGLNDRSANNGDVLQCTYTITLTPS